VDQRGRFVGSGVEKEKLTAGNKQQAIRADGPKAPGRLPPGAATNAFQGFEAWIPAG